MADQEALSSSLKPCKGDQQVPPDVVSMSTCGSSCLSEEDISESSFDSTLVESSIQESCVQADFAERTAEEMKEWMNFWEAYTTQPSGHHLLNLAGANLPHNSLAWEGDEDEDEEEEEITFWEDASVDTSTLKPSTRLDTEYCESSFTSWEVSMPLTPPRPARCVGRNMDDDASPIPATVAPCTPDSPFDMDTSSIPAIAPCTPDSPFDQDTSFCDDESDKHDLSPRQIIYSLLDYCSTHPDESSITADTVLDSFATSSNTTTEELHLQARAQREEVDNTVSGRLQWMEDCLVILREPSTAEESYHSSSGLQIELPSLRIRDKMYLWIAARATRGRDLAYVAFCYSLPLDWLEEWIWFCQHTSPRFRRLLFHAFLLVFAILLPQLSTSPLQPPPQRRFPVTTISSCTTYSAFPSCTTSFHDSLDPDILAEVLL